METEKNGSGTNGRIVMTKKDGVWANGRIGSRQNKVGVDQTVE